MSIINKDFYRPNDNIDLPVNNKWPYNNGEILVCVDVECHCQNQTDEEFQAGLIGRKRRVCEVGVTILDTKDLHNVVPGDRFQNAWPHLKSFSLAVEEHKHCRLQKHTDWCKVGCAEDFLFGTAKWISKSEFRQEFVHTLEDTIIFRKDDGDLRTLDRHEISSVLSCRSEIKQANIVFLMFGNATDKNWLRSLNVDLEAEFPNAVFENIQDSSISMMLAIHLNKSMISAADLLDHLGLPTTKTHNGGNDSVFEMQAFLAPFAMTSAQWSQICVGKKLERLPPIWENPAIIILGTTKHFVSSCLQ